MSKTIFVNGYSEGLYRVIIVSRGLNLRQIEAFKAVIEFGTVSRAAEVLNVSQPAVSKLLTHLEAATGLKLFDRRQGRLATTPQGMRLYEEIERIFAGGPTVVRLRVRDGLFPRCP
jgi:hypothetical protein